MEYLFLHAGKHSVSACENILKIFKRSQELQQLLKEGKGKGNFLFGIALLTHNINQVQLIIKPSR